MTSNPFALDTPSAADQAVRAIATRAADTADRTAPSVTTDLRTPTAPVNTMPADDPFSGPAPQEARGPRLRDVFGRLLLIIPHLVETVPNRAPNAPPGSMQQRMTADLVILDGGPCSYGGAPEKVNGKQHDKVAGVPHRNKRMFISQVGIVSQCRDALERRRQGQPGMVLGRLGAGQAKSDDMNPPYLLTPPTDADKALARAFLATVDPFA